MPHNFQNLAIWQRGCVLAEETYRAFAGSKEFEIKSQMVRSSLSVPSNIAEGAERGTDPDFIRFLNYSKGSAGELFTQATVARNLNILSFEKAEFIRKESLELAAMIDAFIKRLSTN